LRSSSDQVFNPEEGLASNISLSSVTEPMNSSNEMLITSSLSENCNNLLAYINNIDFSHEISSQELESLKLENEQLKSQILEMSNSYSKIVLDLKDKNSKLQNTITELSKRIVKMNKRAESHISVCEKQPKPNIQSEILPKDNNDNEKVSKSCTNQEKNENESKMKEMLKRILDVVDVSIL
jgi:cell division protein FtsB